MRQVRMVFKLVLLVSVLAAAAGAEVPQAINYQGWLTGDDGKGKDTTVSMTFFIYDDSTEGSVVWVESYPDIVVVEGRYNVVLSNLSTEVFNGAERYLAVRVGDEATVSPRVRLASVPFALHTEFSDDADQVDGRHAADFLDKATYDADLDGRVDESAVDIRSVPVGAVIDWWRPDDTYPIPENFKICDGSAVNDTESPLNGVTLPDLTHQFIRGVTDPAEIGTAGGAADHQHTVDITAHNHTMAIDHDHPEQSLSIAYSGDHYHDVSINHTHGSFNTQSTGTHSHGYQVGGNYASGTDFALSPTGNHYHLVTMPTHSESKRSTSTGYHTHSGILDLAAHIETKTASSYGPESLSSSTEANLPPYYGLLRLMRIK